MSVALPELWREAAGGGGRTFPRGLLLAEEEGKVPRQKTTLVPSCLYRAWGLSLGTVVRTPPISCNPPPHAGSGQPSAAQVLISLGASEALGWP